MLSHSCQSSSMVGKIKVKKKKHKKNDIAIYLICKKNPFCLLCSAVGHILYMYICVYIEQKETTDAVQVCTPTHSPTTQHLCSISMT